MASREEPSERTAATPAQDFASEFQLALVELHARITLRMPLVQALFVISVASLVLGQVPLWKFLAWTLAVVLIESARALYSLRLLRRLPQLDPFKTLRCQIGQALLAGAHAGSLGPLFLQHLSPDNQIFLNFFLVAMPAIGVAVSISSRIMAAAYAGVILLPTAINWVLLYPQHLLPAAVGATAYLTVLVFAARENEKLLVRSVSIRRERDQVLQELQASHAQVQAAVHRAEAAALARTRVLAAASHDLRQPLHALSVYSAVLAAQPTPATLKDVAGHIDQLVRSLGALLHGLLDLSQLSSGHYSQTRQAFELHRLLEDACAEFAEAARAKGLSLQSDLVPLNVNGDSIGLLRMVRNLIDNAIKYTERGSVQVQLRLEPQNGETGKMAVVAIRDTGKGIALADQPHIFEEFYQVGNVGRDRSLGVGLGLAIVDRLATLTGAKLRLQSEPGRGSCFEIWIPHVLPTAVVPEPRTADTVIDRWPTPHPPRIFVLDDEAPILQSMRWLLEAWGLVVHTAQDAASASHLFASLGRPDLLLADMRLQGAEHGPTLAAHWHAAHGPFPVIYLTGDTASEALREARATGARVLHKPVDPAQLRRAIHLELSLQRDALP